MKKIVQLSHVHLHVGKLHFLFACVAIRIIISKPERRKCMNKVFRKSEIWFSVIVIVIYSVLQSLAIEGNKRIGVEYSASAVAILVLAIWLYWFIRKNDLSEYY